MKHMVRFVLAGVFFSLFLPAPSPTDAQLSAKVVSWSPDGTLLAVVEDGTLRLLDALTFQPTLVIHSPVNDFDAAAWHPDGTRLATNASLNSDGLRVWDAATGALLAHFREVSDPDGGFGMVEWSPDGTKIATAQATGTGTLPVHLWSAEDDQYSLFATLEDGGTQVYSISWSPDSTQLAVTSYEGFFVTSNIDTDRPMTRRVSIPFIQYVVAWSPDGSQLVISSRAPTMYQLDYKIYIVDAASYEVLSVLPGSSGVRLAWSPSGDQLAATSREGIDIWDVTTRQRTMVVPATQLSFSWNPVNEQFAYIGDPPLNADARVESLGNGVQIVVPR